MKSRTQRLARYITLAATLTAAGSWSTAAYACAAEPYLSAVCVMAWARNDLRGFAPANGQMMSLSQNTALFSLLGTTYGGNGQTTFALPDLRGRTVIGAGTGPLGTFNVGQIGGSTSVTLTGENLPSHTHVLAPVALAGVTAGLDLSKITNNTSSAALTGVPFTANISQLRLRALNSSASTASPANASLAVSAGSPNRMYTSTAPDVDMSPQSIAGSITVASTGTAAVTLGGSATLNLTGTLPAGVTGATGNNASVSTMSPYLAMYYFIATSGIFPSSN